MTTHATGDKPRVQLDLSNIDGVIDLAPTVKRLDDLGIFRALGPANAHKVRVAIVNSYLIGVAAALLALEAAGWEIDADTVSLQTQDL